MQQTTGLFTMKQWDEQPYREQEGQPKMAQAEVVFSYSGQIDGESFCRYLLTYGEKRASYVGLHRFVGTIDGREGTVDFQEVGIFENGTPIPTITILPDTATDGLVGITGQGSYAGSEEEGTVVFTLDYTIE